jgi:dTDP-4-dehydrorhamnose 3,5-epimerase
MVRSGAAFDHAGAAGSNGLSMQIDDTAIPDVKVITPRRFSDSRGFFAEWHNESALREAGLHFSFCQDNLSLSERKGTVRGLHFQLAPMAQAKLVGVMAGRALDVALDLRLGSPTYLRHVAVELSAERGNQILVPEGFAHGFCTLADATLVFYKITAPYSPRHDSGIHWADPSLGITWPVAERDAILSDKDRGLPRLDRANPPFRYPA